MKWDRDALESPHTRRELGQIEINTDPAYVREFAATCSYTERQMILALLGKLEAAVGDSERLGEINSRLDNVRAADAQQISDLQREVEYLKRADGPPRWWKTCDECHRPQGQPHAAICHYGPGTVIKSQTFGGCR